MLIATGIALVLITWLALVLLLVLTGLVPSLLVQRGPVDTGTLRRSLWWGVLIITLAVLAGSMVAPIRSTGFAVYLAVVVVIAGVTGLALARTRGWAASYEPARTLWLVAIPSLLAVVALAAAALGPITNYDTGLYHLGAIAYAFDYAAMPGLANLYQPLGYATAQFPLAAAMGVGPWGEDGFRLLNGLIITLVVVDLILRFLRKRSYPGTWIQLVGATALLVSMVALADYWVTSPSQDAAVFALTVSAVAYLADALTRRRSFAANGATALAISIVAVLVRPTVVFFAATLAGVLLVRAWSWRRPAPKRVGAAITAVGVSGVLALVLATARDYLLSGWFQYPLSLLSFDVPWRAGDPTPLREATLGFHRDPDDLWGSVSGYEWVGSWLIRATSRWEMWLALMLAGIAIVLLVVALRRGRLRWRSLVMTMLPSAVALGGWFLVSPPAFRFAWGPLVTIAAIPAGWGLWLLKDRAGTHLWQLAAALGFASAVAGVSLLTLLTRTEWSEMTLERNWSAGISIPYGVSPLQTPEVKETELSSGLTVLVPIDGELCWDAFPLCTPRTVESLRLAGQTLQEGLLP